MKCPNCGAENPEDNNACGNCGSPLKLGSVLSFKMQRRLAKQTACIILLISAILIIIGLGFKGEADKLPINTLDNDMHYVDHALLDLAWLFGLLGIAGFFVTGLAYLFSLPTPKKERGSSLSSEKTIGENPKGP
jgi:predicted nucleic acid-binding Zn ribbon protein